MRGRNMQLMFDLHLTPKFKVQESSYDTAVVKQNRKKLIKKNLVKKKMKQIKQIYKP